MSALNMNFLDYGADGVSEIELGRSDHNNRIAPSDKILNSLGYKVEFRREMSLFGVLGLSFCAIGILTGMSSAFQTGLFSGGPLGLFWGWNVSALHDRLRSLIVDPIDLQRFHALNSSLPRGDLQCLVRISILFTNCMLIQLIVRPWEAYISGFVK